MFFRFNIFIMYTHFFIYNAEYLNLAVISPAERYFVVSRTYLERKVSEWLWDSIQYR